MHPSQLRREPVPAIDFAIVPLEVALTGCRLGPFRLLRRWLITRQDGCCVRHRAPGRH
jgi:hypothetical protein